MHRALLLLIGAVPGAAGASVHGITDGVDDDGDPAVVALLGGGAIRCSGALVSPRVVLTAAHCLVPPPEAVFFGSAPELGGVSLAVMDTRPHPAYHEVTHDNDIGLLVLAAGASAGPLPLAPGALGASSIGAPLRLVGFGLASGVSPSSLRKRSGTTTLGALAATTFEVRPDPALPCAGDSGGPALLEDRIAGVASNGDPACTAFAREMRVDAYRDFIVAYVDAAREAGAGPGERCFYDENCARGSCVAPADAPRIRYCAPPCAAPSDCPPAMECGPSGACRYAGQSPGADGTTCGADYDCDGAVCAAAAGDDPVCATRCFPERPGCPAGQACLPDDAHPGALACLEAPATGCSAASDPPPGGAAALLVLATIRRARRAARQGRLS